MKVRDGAVWFASATVFTGAAVGMSPDIAHAYDVLTTPHIDIAAGRIALGEHLSQNILDQQDAVVEIDTAGVPTYVTIQGQQYRSSDTPLMGSGVVLPMTDKGERLIATAGHVGIRNDGGEYNCADQIVNSFAPGDTSYVQEPAKSGYGELNKERDAAVIKTADNHSLTPVSKIADDPMDHLKNGTPIYITGYSHSGADGEDLFGQRTPANVVAHASELNTPDDDSHPITIGGLALSVDTARKQLFVITSVDRSYGPAYNDKIYAGDSGGAAFNSNGDFIGVLTGMYPMATPDEIKDTYNVRLTNPTAPKYQVSIVNLMNTADVKRMAAATKACPEVPDPIIDGEK